MSRVRGYTWRIITGCCSDDWIYWCFYTITLSYNQYSAIADLHTFQFTFAQVLGFSVSRSRILATDINTGIITWNRYEVFLSFLLQSPWAPGSSIVSLQSPWFLTLCSIVLIWPQESESESRYNWRSVSRSVLVSSPLWGSWPQLKTVSLYSLGSDPMENPSFAQQRMSYCCHARFSGRTHREQ
jgi:hypothetical protein